MYPPLLLAYVSCHMYPVKCPLLYIPVICPSLSSISCQMSLVKCPPVKRPCPILIPQSNSHSNLSTPMSVNTAQHMKSKRFMKGEILYCKGELVENIYLVVSGEYLLDVEDLTGTRKQHPFLNSNQDNCYHMSGESLGVVDL